MRIFILALLICGCQAENGNWAPLLSSQKWYDDIDAKEKRLIGKIYDKGITKWIIKEDFKAEKGIVKDEVLAYKKGEEYNRFLFETSVTLYDLYLEDFWACKRMIEVLKLDDPKEAKRLYKKKFEIIGKERVVFVEEGGKEIKRREFVPRMIKEK